MAAPKKGKRIAEGVRSVNKRSIDTDAMLRKCDATEEKQTEQGRRRTGEVGGGGYWLSLWKRWKSRKRGCHLGGSCSTKYTAVNEE